MRKQYLPYTHHGANQARPQHPSYSYRHTNKVNVTCQACSDNQFMTWSRDPTHLS